jgi:hypothetical protein
MGGFFGPFGDRAAELEKISGTVDPESDEARIARLVADAEKEVLASYDLWLVRARSEHKLQSYGFLFECTRWGNFLNLRVMRGGNPDGKRRFATTINMGLVTEIRLVEGHPADTEGKVDYQLRIGATWYVDSLVNISDVTERSFFYSSQPPIPMGGQHSINGSGGYAGGGGAAGHFHGYPTITVGPSPAPIVHTTTPFPRFAYDDYIEFVGVGRLYTPAGLGAAVLEQIHLELDKNSR